MGLLSRNLLQVFEHRLDRVYHWSKNHYTHNFYCWGINIAITHISYTALIVEELICVMRVYLWCLPVCPYDISERQLHNNNARGTNIQLHAHQLQINNCWGINCVTIPAPIVNLNAILAFLPSIATAPGSEEYLKV